MKCVEALSLVWQRLSTSVSRNGLLALFFSPSFLLVEFDVDLFFAYNQNLQETVANCLYA
jgi:hypothetical protein